VVAWLGVIKIKNLGGSRKKIIIVGDWGVGGGTSAMG